MQQGLGRAVMECTFDKQWMKMHGLVEIILTLGFYSKTWLNDAFMCLQNGVGST